MMLCEVGELQHQLAYRYTHTHRLSPTLWVTKLGGAFVAKWWDGYA